MKNKNPGILHLILRVLQGILIGVGRSAARHLRRCALRGLRHL